MPRTKKTMRSNMDSFRQSLDKSTNRGFNIAGHDFPTLVTGESSNSNPSPIPSSVNTNGGNLYPSGQTIEWFRRLSEAGAMNFMNFGGGATVPRPQFQLHATGQPILPLAPQRGGVRAQHETPGSGNGAAPNPEEALITKSTYKRSRNLFNKLTLDNFESLTPFFLSLPLADNDERISNLVSVMFEKAIERPSSSSVYARMLQVICKSSHELCDKFIEKIRRYLHNDFVDSMRIRKELRKEENKLTASTDIDGSYKKQLWLNLEKSQELSRKRARDITKFIGELYLVQIVTPKILMGRVNSLLTAAYEEINILCICDLFIEVGHALSQDLKALGESTPSPSGFLPDPNWMKNVFGRLQGFLQEKTMMSAELGYTIAVVNELWERDWNNEKNSNRSLASSFMNGVLPSPTISTQPPKPVQLPRQCDDIKANKTENVTSTPKAVDDLEAEALIIKSISNRTRQLLNELTLDSFTTLEPSFLALPLENKADRILSFISIMFENVIEKPSLSSIYARMLHAIYKASPETEATSLLFTKQILQLSSKKFLELTKNKKEIKVIEEQLANTKSNEKLLQLKLNLNKKKTLVRKISLGNVGFLSELYKVQILTPKIIVGRVNVLLNAGEDEGNFRCLCALLTNVGQMLTQDLQQLAETASEGWDGLSFIPDPKWMDKVFKRLHDFSSNKATSARLSTPISNLFELRKSWGNQARKQSKISSTVTSREVVPTITKEAAPAHKNTLLPKNENETSTNPVTGTSTGLSACEEILDTEVKNAAVTLQQLSQQGIDANLDKKLELLKYIRNLAQTMESLRNLRKAKCYEMELAKDNNNETKCKTPKVSNDQSNQILNCAETGGPSKSTGNSVRIVKVDTFSATTGGNKVTDDGVKDMADEDNICAKIVFQEYLGCKNFDDTLTLIKKRFLGNRIEEFVEKLTRQVCELSKEAEQKLAASIVRLLIRKGEIRGTTVMEILARGVIQDLPGILSASPKAPENLASFLVELFLGHNNLGWLLQVGDKLKQTTEKRSVAVWRRLVANCLNFLKSRKDEEYVRTAFKQTEENFAIPIHEIPWLNDYPGFRYFD